MSKPSSLWLSVSHDQTSSVLNIFNEGLEALALPATSYPRFIAFVGRKSKSAVLRCMTNGRDHVMPDSSHGKVYLWAQRSSRAENPTILIDYELSQPHASRWEPVDCYPASRMPLRWVSRNPHVNRRMIGNMFCSQVLASFADILCYYASDLEGTQGVAALIAEQLSRPSSSDAPRAALPHVLVVYDTSSKAFEPRKIESDLKKAIEGKLKAGGQLLEKDFEKVLHTHIRRLDVLGLQTGVDNSKRGIMLRKRLTAIQAEVLHTKKMHGFVFIRDHLLTLLDAALQRFGADCNEPFSFALETRPADVRLSEFKYHVEQLVDLISNSGSTQSTSLWMELFCPLVSTAMFLACYPTGCHIFSMPWLYEKLFEDDVQRALRGYSTVTPGVDVITREIQRLLNKDWQHLQRGEYSVRELHRNNLTRLGCYLSTIHSNRSCLSCLLRTPEKILQCGHSLCDTCVRIFGQESKEHKYSFYILQCPLCREPHQSVPVRLIPPTAGIRAISIDGGGIRGVVPLEFLAEVERTVQDFGAPIQDYFDYACGTSAGGLVVLGIFAMEWSATECLEKFERLAKETFTRPTSFLFGKFRHLVLSYLRDYSYSAEAIQHAFRSAYGSERKLLKPLLYHTRVAVSTTTMSRKPKLYLLNNYNGPVRSAHLGCSFSRPPKICDEVSIDQAARATSAAPGLFQPVYVHGAGHLQDGGLLKNNPISLVDSEVKRLWPQDDDTKSTFCDFVLSLGTGTGTASSQHDSSWRRSLLRCVDSFFATMDGEEEHKNYNLRLSPQQTERYERVNLPLSYGEPFLTDVTAMQKLSEHARVHIRRNGALRGFLDLSFASMFYFELDDLPTWEQTPGDEGRWLCTGHVFCRQSHSQTGRAALARTLKDTSSYFRVSETLPNGSDRMPHIIGQPYQCVERLTKSAPPFRRRLTFPVSHLDAKIGITIYGATSQPRTISGLPKSSRQLIKAQGLAAPFGRADCAWPEKKLPRVPSKRKYPDWL